MQIVQVLFNTVQKAKLDMIISFADEQTERLFRTGEEPTVPRDVAQKALQRLDWLDAGSRLHDIAAPNGLRLHKHPKRDESGWYIIHVRDTWWIAFRWVHPDCSDVSLFQKR
jgi:plasmid maintenance system killer protein